MNSLKIANATLPDRNGYWNIAIADGSITEITQTEISSEAKGTLDAKGQSDRQIA